MLMMWERIIIKHLTTDKMFTCIYTVILIFLILELTP